MRYLKNKVYKAVQTFSDIHVKQEAPEELPQKVLLDHPIVVKQEPAIVIKQEAPIIVKQEPQYIPKKESTVKSVGRPSKGSPGGKKDVQTNKNIVKNYARAMVNFALSDIALNYLRKMVQAEGVELKGFRAFVSKQKEDINSIKTLREMLLIKEGERRESCAYKKIFQAVSEIFVKFFSVNWIFNSKVSDKKLHLKYRFKILRRVRNPEHFTYLENFNKTR